MSLDGLQSPPLLQGSTMTAHRSECCKNCWLAWITDIRESQTLTEALLTIKIKQRQRNMRSDSPGAGLWGCQPKASAACRWMVCAWCSAAVLPACALLAEDTEVSDRSVINYTYTGLSDCSWRVEWPVLAAHLYVYPHQFLHLFSPSQPLIPPSHWSLGSRPET